MSSSVLIRPVDNPSEFLRFDAVMQESYNGAAQPTDYAVEFESDSTDHIIRSQERMTMVGVISDFPLKLEKESVPQATSYPTRGDKRSLGAFDFLRDAKDRGRRLNVQTSLLLYKNMVIESLVVKRDSATSHIIEAEISFREIVISSTQRVEVPKNIGRGRRKTISFKKITEAVAATADNVKAVIGAFKDATSQRVVDTPTSAQELRASTRSFASKATGSDSVFERYRSI